MAEEEVVEQLHYYNLHTAVDVDMHIVVDYCIAVAEVFVDSKQAVAAEHLSFHWIDIADTDCILADFQADYIPSVVEASYYNFVLHNFVVDIVHLSVHNMAADRH